MRIEGAAFRYEVELLGSFKGEARRLNLGSHGFEQGRFRDRRIDSSRPSADEDAFEGGGHCSAPSEDFPLGEDGGDRFDEFAP